MYQVSRAIYRAVEPRIAAPTPEIAAARKAAVLNACENVVKRMATEPNHFKFPIRTLLNDIRQYFDIPEQGHVHAVIKTYLVPAKKYVAEHPREAYASVNDTPLTCRATTRKGALCQRTPHVDGYCPSHQHLAETEHSLVA